MTYFLRPALLFDNSCLKSIIRSQVLFKARVSTSSLNYNQKTFDEQIEKQTLNRLKEQEPFINYAKQCENLKHFANNGELVVVKKEEDYTLPHPIWSKYEAEEVEVTHRKPKGFTDNLAYLTVSAMRLGFDIFSGYKVQLRLGTLDERAVLTRYI